MSLRPEDRSSRRRDRSHSRSRDERSRSRHEERDHERRKEDRKGDREQKKKDSSPPRRDRHESFSSTYPPPPPPIAGGAAVAAAMGPVTMPAMPAMPDLTDDYLRHSNYPPSRPSQPYPPLPAGSVPYPTSDFFPDPEHYDVTGVGSPSIEDSLAYGHSPYSDKRSQPPSAMDAYKSQPPGSFPDFQPPAAAAPPPSAFYGTSSSTRGQGPTPQRTSSYDRPPEPSQFYPSAGDSSKHRPAPAPGSQLTPGGTAAAAPADLAPGGRPRASSNLSVNMGHLAISTPSHGSGGNLPPPSPLLEAYRGTYQSVSPMVAPMARFSDSEMSDMEQLDDEPKVKEFKPGKSSSKGDKKDKSDKRDKHSKSDKKDRSSKSDTQDKVKFAAAATAAAAALPDVPTHRTRKSVTLYEPATDAVALSRALSHSHASNVDTDTITRVLPELTHDQILALRKEYKNVAKVNGKGINLSKHLKLKLSGNYGKAAYVTALGRWESEGYWANFFYQSHGSRRELLIESLMGRTNAEVRAIKDDFRDKRYSDDLRKMVERELRADKFRAAVLIALEERRQEETDAYGDEVVRRDVQVLAGCLRTTQGGESAMLEIVVRRSDAHLRLVLNAFERDMRINFAREALKRSGNLVGEVLAHILNGVINRPARDALLLKHAIQDIAQHNRDEELRYELLISRLVRFHWDRAHLDRVKKEYAAKNGRKLEDDIAKATKGDFKDFMVELCEPRG